MSKVLVDRELLERCVELLDLLPESRTIVGVRAILAQPAEAEVSLADRMRAAGMMTIEEMLAEAPLDRFIKHAGVNDLEKYGQWLDMKCREFLSMQASRELEKREDDDLYEWVLAHAAAFQEARINFKAARDAHLAALSAVTAERDRLREELERNQLWHKRTTDAGAICMRERDQLRAEVEELRPIHAMILNALDRDAEEGRTARGEMAAELRAAMAAKEA